MRPGPAAAPAAPPKPPESNTSSSPESGGVSRSDHPGPRSARKRQRSLRPPGSAPAERHAQITAGPGRWPWIEPDMDRRAQRAALCLSVTDQSHPTPPRRQWTLPRLDRMRSYDGVRCRPAGRVIGRDQLALTKRVTIQSRASAYARGPAAPRFVDAAERQEAALDTEPLVPSPPLRRAAIRAGCLVIGGGDGGTRPRGRATPACQQRRLVNRWPGGGLEPEHLPSLGAGLAGCRSPFCSSPWGDGICLGRAPAGLAKLRRGDRRRFPTPAGPAEGPVQPRASSSTARRIRRGRARAGSSGHPSESPEAFAPREPRRRWPGWLREVFPARRAGSPLRLGGPMYSKRLVELDLRRASDGRPLTRGADAPARVRRRGACEEGRGAPLQRGDLRAVFRPESRGPCVADVLGSTAEDPVLLAITCFNPDSRHQASSNPDLIDGATSFGTDGRGVHAGRRRSGRFAQWGYSVVPYDGSRRPVGSGPGHPRSGQRDPGGEQWAGNAMPPSSMLNL